MGRKCNPLLGQNGAPCQEVSGHLGNRLDVNGAVNATSFSGSGSGLTGITTSGLVDGSVTASKLASGVVPKFISLDTLAIYITGAATKDTGFGPHAGVYLPDGASSSTIQAGFIIPPNYTPGTPLVIHMLWNTPGTGNIRFRGNYISVARAGSAHLEGASTDTGLTIVGGDLLAAPSTVNNSKETQIQVTSPVPGGNLAPGDSIIFGFYRASNDASDTCPGSMIIQGLWVTYQ